MSQHIERCIELLERTQDGNQLAPGHLSLVEFMVNAGAHEVSETTEAAFETLYQQVSEGRYDHRQQWLHGQYGLTKDHEGFVSWKGTIVEHYSFSSATQEREAAQRLAIRCRELEAKGFPVCSRTLLCDAFFQAPADTPWLSALLSLYCTQQHSDGRAAAIFSRGGDAVVLHCERGYIQRIECLREQDFEAGCLRGYYALQSEGYASSKVDLDGYEPLVRWLTRQGISPRAVTQALARLEASKEQA